MSRVLIAPSILSADYLNFGRDIRKVEKAGADLIHFDVMDGSFVPNITFGMGLAKKVRSITKLPLDVHLMIVNPHKYIESFCEAGADYITIHLEASKNIKKDLKEIKKRKIHPGISINPDTPVKKLLPVLDMIEMALIMSVYPGFGGQKYIPESSEKIAELKSILKKRNSNIKIEVDGGINEETAPLAIKAGADILVAGVAVFKENDWKKAIKNLRG